MKIKSTILLIMLITLMIYTNNNYGQVGITFSLSNSAITNDGSFDYYEFDIIAEATGNSQFKLAQVYIDYSTAGFGGSIFSSGNVTVSEGELLADVIQGIPPNFGFGDYTITLNDNSPSKLSVANDFTHSAIGTYSGMGYELSNLLGTSQKVYARVKIKIQNPSELSGISLDATVSQFELQQYYYTTPGTDDQVNYSPVNDEGGLNEPLPVELASFTAEANGNKVDLSWETATELNNYGFDIERSIKSGENEEPLWVTIGFAEGNGNSNSPKQYSFTDNNPYGGSWFVYRLKQIDTDGSYEYSDEIEVEIVPTIYVLYQNYPNPFNPVTNIKFSLPEAGKVSIIIYNSLGELVTELVNKDFDAGYHKVEFRANRYASGVYIYRLVSNNFVATKKMLLLK